MCRFRRSEHSRGAKDGVEGRVQTMALALCTLDQTPWCYISHLWVCWCVSVCECPGEDRTSWLLTFSRIFNLATLSLFAACVCVCVCVFRVGFEEAPPLCSCRWSFCMLYYLWCHYSRLCAPEANLVWRLCAGCRCLPSEAAHMCAVSAGGSFVVRTYSSWIRGSYHANITLIPVSYD